MSRAGGGPPCLVMIQGPVLWAGFSATVLAACWYWLIRSVSWTQYSPSVQLGCLVLREPRGPVTETLGFLLFLALGSLLFPVLYAPLLGSMGGPSGTNGAVLGLVHGFIFVAALPLAGTIDACVRGGRLPSPGWWGLGWGRATPWLIVAGHALYGSVLGAILAAF